MQLANPFALILLLFLLPLLLVARLRRPPERRRVSHLPFWTAAAAPDTPAPTRRIRRDWLLLLQAALIVTLVLALARPSLPSAGETVALVMDVSMSMSAPAGAGSRLDAARARASERIAALPRRSRVHLISADAVPSVAGSFRAGDTGLRQALTSLHPTAAQADVLLALQSALRLDPAPDRVLVFTDAPRPPGVRASPPVEWIASGPPKDNAAIVIVSARRFLSTTGEVQTLVEVANYGSSPARGNLTLSHQGTELWRESIDVAAHGRKAVTRVVTLESGIITATLDHPDAIAADNVRSAVIAPATIGVRLRGASFHVERALASHPGLRLLPERTSTAPDAGRDEADILVCGGCAEVPSGGAPVLLIPPRPPSSAGVSETSLTPIVTTGRALPLADAFEGAVVPVRVDRPVADTDVAARAGGLPVVVAHDDGVRRIVELRFDPEASPFARGTGFPVLIATALDWLSLPSRNHQTVTAGEAVQWFLPGVPSISVTGPDGHAPAFTFAGGRLLARPSTAGIYRVRAGGAELALVVNPATDESDLSSNRPEAVARAAAPSGSQPARVDATGWLAIGALLILAAEWRYRHRHSRVKQA